MQATGNNIIIKELQEEEFKQTESGLIIPNIVSRGGNPLKKGEVVSVGGLVGFIAAHPKRLDDSIKEGAKVIFYDNGTKFMHEDNEYHIVNENSIALVL